MARVQCVPAPFHRASPTNWVWGFWPCDATFGFSGRLGTPGRMPMKARSSGWPRKEENSMETKDYIANTEQQGISRGSDVTAIDARRQQPDQKLNGHAKSHAKKPL